MKRPAALLVSSTQSTCKLGISQEDTVLYALFILWNLLCFVWGRSVDRPTCGWSWSYGNMELFISAQIGMTTRGSSVNIRSKHAWNVLHPWPTLVAPSWDPLSIRIPVTYFQYPPGPLEQLLGAVASTVGALTPFPPPTLTLFHPGLLVLPWGQWKYSRIPPRYT